MFLLLYLLNVIDVKSHHTSKLALMIMIDSVFSLIGWITVLSYVFRMWR